MALPAYMIRLEELGGRKGIIMETNCIRKISFDDNLYHRWPSLGIDREGTLYLDGSARFNHRGPFGRVFLMMSYDSGENWSWPQTLIDGPIDDRYAGVTVTANNTIIVTTFSSTDYMTSATFETNENWKAAHRRLQTGHSNHVSGWMIRPVDVVSHGRQNTKFDLNMDLMDLFRLRT